MYVNYEHWDFGGSGIEVSTRSVYVPNRNSLVSLIRSAQLLLAQLNEADARLPGAPQAVPKDLIRQLECDALALQLLKIAKTGEYNATFVAGPVHDAAEAIKHLYLLAEPFL